MSQRRGKPEGSLCLYNERSLFVSVGRGTDELRKSRFIVLVGLERERGEERGLERDRQGRSKVEL